MDCAVTAGKEVYRARRNSGALGRVAAAWLVAAVTGAARQAVVVAPLAEEAEASLLAGAAMAAARQAAVAADASPLVEAAMAVARQVVEVAADASPLVEAAMAVARQVVAATVAGPRAEEEAVDA